MSVHIPVVSLIDAKQHTAVQILYTHTHTGNMCTCSERGAEPISAGVSLLRLKKKNHKKKSPQFQSQ